MAIPPSGETCSPPFISSPATPSSGTRTADAGECAIRTMARADGSTKVTAYQWLTLSPLKPWAQPSQILECVLVLLMAIGTGQEARSRNFNVFENLVHRDC